MDTKLTLSNGVSVPQLCIHYTLQLGAKKPLHRPSARTAAFNNRSYFSLL